MSLAIETHEYGITFLEPLLGSAPADPKIHATYIASKAPLQQQADEENQVIQE